MKYSVCGQVPGGGWSMTVEADSPQEALSKGIAQENLCPHPNGRTHEVSVYEYVGYQGVSGAGAIPIRCLAKASF